MPSACSGGLYRRHFVEEGQNDTGRKHSVNRKTSPVAFGLLGLANEPPADPRYFVLPHEPNSQRVSKRRGRQ